MKNELVGELNSLFYARCIAKELNVSNFPYCETIGLFNEKLKIYLSSLFGDEIRFDREETFAYIQAHYKNVPIEINTYGGIILTVEDIEREDVVRELMEVFTGFLDFDPICRYNFCSKNGESVTVFPTIEWNTNPDARLNDIIKCYMTIPGESWVSDIEDYYNTAIIKSLGKNLFTFEGYKKVFNPRYNDYKNVNHRIIQIQKLNPNLDRETIYAWINSCRKTMDISKDGVKKKVYIDDGK